jgi:hypothetical protein
MTASLKFSFRRDEGGFVVHVSGTSRYLHANEAAELALRQLQGSDVGGDAKGAAEIAAVLRGERERLVAATDTDPEVVPLSDRMGAAADRCETFGMPL